MVHTTELYSYMRQIAPQGLVVGLDEVGRGALAGPLTVACVALPDEPMVVGIDDSKKLTPKRRLELAKQIRTIALGYGIAHIPPGDIDAYGMAKSIRIAMLEALESCIQDLAAKGHDEDIDAVLIDGVPLHIHEKETCIVKGDGKVACIAAASVLAKATRDELMCDLDESFPAFGFAKNKGYGSSAHMQAIREHGPSVVHRESFLGNILAEQQRLL